MNDLQRFHQLLIIALSNVEDSYYRTTYQNIENFRAALNNRVGKFSGNNFERYGERVFCYEFYHQLRILIDAERLVNAAFLNEAKLQAEVQKMQISELIQRLNLNPMSGEFAPDFLMHSPSNANLHPCVIEVKCEHDVTPAKVLKDLLKLNEFITNYHYQSGIFIAINASNTHISNVLNEIAEEINELAGRNSIQVICKEAQNINHQIWLL